MDGFKDLVILLYDFKVNFNIDFDVSNYTIFLCGSVKEEDEIRISSLCESEGFIYNKEIGYIICEVRDD